MFCVIGISTRRAAASRDSVTEFLTPSATIESSSLICSSDFPWARPTPV